MSSLLLCRPGPPLSAVGRQAARVFETSEVSDPAALGNEWARWPTPAIPAHVQGVPRGYFVAAYKR